MLGVVMLGVVMLSVVAPTVTLQKSFLTSPNVDFSLKLFFFFSDGWGK
jgi:hypothetical protein